VVEVKVTVEFRGDDLEEVGLFLIQLGSLLEKGVEDQEREDGQDGEGEEELEGNSAWWTPERAATFVNELTDPALRALAVIADHAPKVSFREVQREMMASGMPIPPGRLSSIGFAVRRLGYRYPPFVRDYYQRAYQMDTDTAEVLKPAIRNELRRRGL
jgi:hypothetical protein